MEELIKLVSEKAGLTPDKAQMAVQLILNHLKSKAPALSGQIDSLVSGGSAGLSDVAGGLGGMLGGKK